MSKPQVKRRPMSSDVINPQTTVFKSFTSEEFHNYGIVFVLIVPSVVSLVYCIFFGIHGYNFMTTPTTSDIRLVDAWFWHDTVKSSHLYLLFFYCLPSIIFLCVQLYRWSKFLFKAQHSHTFGMIFGLHRHTGSRCGPYHLYTCSE